MIDEHALRACLGEDVHESSHSTHEHEPAVAPGQSLLHYSPKIDTVLVCDLDEARKHWLSSTNFLLRKSAFEGLAETLGDRPVDAVNFLLSDNPILFARELYQALYASEKNPLSSLVVVLPEKNTPAWRAFVDRLKRTERIKQL